MANSILESGPKLTADSTQRVRVTVKTGSLRGRNVGDQVFFWGLRLVSWATIALFVGMLIFIGNLAWDAVKAMGFRFWLGDDWNPPMEIFGAAPFIVGTLASSAIAVCIAAPVSIGTALFLREIAPRCQNPRSTRA